MSVPSVEESLSITTTIRLYTPMRSSSSGSNYNDRSPISTQSYSSPSKVADYIEWVSSEFESSIRMANSLVYPTSIENASHPPAAKVGALFGGYSMVKEKECVSDLNSVPSLDVYYAT